MGKRTRVGGCLFTVTVAALAMGARGSELDGSYSVFDTYSGGISSKHKSATSAGPSLSDGGAGAFTSYSVNSQYGDASISGVASVAAYTDSNSGQYASGTGTVSWTDSYLVMPSDPALIGHAGVMHSTFHVAGQVSVSSVPNSSGENDVTVSIDGGPAGRIGYNWYTGGDPDVRHYSTIPYDKGFTFGVPFDYGAGLTGYIFVANYNADYLGGATFKQNLELSAGAYSISDGSGNGVSYTVTANTGSGSGVNVSTGQRYLLNLTNALPAGHGTTLDILGGTASGDTAIHGNFVATDANGNVAFASDAVEFGGTGKDKFVIQMTYDPAAVSDPSALMLAWKNPATGLWENAVDGNTPDSVPQAIAGAYDANTDFVLGDYGVDTASHTVWAVIDHNSEFAAGVVAAPEPASVGVLGLATAGLLMRRKRGS